MGIKNNISEDLLKLIDDEDFKNLSQKLNVYCPFNALSIIGKEIRHSNFLADIITPSNPHGFDDHILRSISQALLIVADKPKLALKLHLSDLTKAEVIREWGSKGKKKKKNAQNSKRLDLLIRFPELYDNKDLIIAIEIKINSKESDDQLKTYRENVEAKFKNAEKIFIYLTLEGDDPDTDDKNNWRPVGFRYIISVIEKTLQEGRGVQLARKMVESYVDMINREHLEDPITEEMAANIWSNHKAALNYLNQDNTSDNKEIDDIKTGINSKHQAALKFLMDRGSTEIEEIIKTLRDEIFLAKIKNAFKAKNCSITFEPIESRSRIGVSYKIREWDQYDDFKKTEYEQIISVYVSFKYKECRISLTLVPGDVEVRRKLYEVFLKRGVLKKVKTKIKDKWTRFYAETIRNEKDFKILLDDLDNNKVEHLIEDIIGKFTEIIPPFHAAIIEAAEKGEIQ